MKGRPSPLKGKPRTKAFVDKHRASAFTAFRPLPPSISLMLTPSSARSRTAVDDKLITQLLSEDGFKPKLVRDGSEIKSAMGGFRHAFNSITEVSVDELKLKHGPGLKTVAVRVRSGEMTVHIGNADEPFLLRSTFDSNIRRIDGNSAGKTREDWPAWLRSIPAECARRRSP